MSNPPSYSQILLSRKHVESQGNPPGPTPEAKASDEQKLQSTRDTTSKSPSITQSGEQSGRTSPASTDAIPAHSQSEISALEKSVKALELIGNKPQAEPNSGSNGTAAGDEPANGSTNEISVGTPTSQKVRSVAGTNNADEKLAPGAAFASKSHFGESVPFANQLPNLPVTRIDAPSDEPDERLIDALDNPRDRLFILRFEQETHAFVQKKASLEMQVPPMNAYHRLLVHQLAEYYRLTHVSDEKGSITLRVSEHTRIPASRIADIAASRNSGQDTPPAVPAVKMIMRRRQSIGSGGGSGDGSSDKGANGSEEQRAIDTKTSREEREAAYQAARQRIFGDFKESSDTNPPKKSEKTTPKKPVVDDDFSDRSQFFHIPQPQYYPQPHFQAPASTPYTPQWPATAPLQPPPTRPNAAAPVWSPGVTGYTPNVQARGGADFPHMPQPNQFQHGFSNIIPQQHRPAFNTPSAQQHFPVNFPPQHPLIPDKNRYNQSFPSSAVSTPPPYGGIVRPPTVPPSMSHQQQGFGMGGNNMGGNNMASPNHMHIGNSAMQRGHSMNSSFKPTPVGPPSGSSYGGFPPHANQINDAFNHQNGMPNHNIGNQQHGYNNVNLSPAPQNVWPTPAWQQNWNSQQPLGNNSHVNIGNGTFANQQRKDFGPGPVQYGNMAMNGQTNQYGMGRH